MIVGHTQTLISTKYEENACTTRRRAFVSALNEKKVNEDVDDGHDESSFLFSNLSIPLIFFFF
jgi:hypothetical protein